MRKLKTFLLSLSLLTLAACSTMPVPADVPPAKAPQYLTETIEPLSETPIDSILDIMVSFFSVADYAYACVVSRQSLINWLKLTQGE